ncbi:helix-turn-helix domain-containing protein [Lawsonibacter asaccharolyticus]|uniref:helix-turn-helix domain-containing protein n=1 Tax=Lawsonibacter asaccharolyticus TaxID=2108523 RepID=UPI0026594866|nr:helix-turn-helix domain-containing protein [Lawsonibacter asaccharolyticus]UMM47423.1 helix-turn-helix domain-containing protein [Lawsonibacter asaccharolyticus]
MSDFQKLLDQALEKVNLTPVDDTPEVEEYNIDAEVRDLVISTRSAANLTQKQLAQRSGVSQSNISKIENGNYQPSLSTLKRIAGALGKRLVVSFEDPEV